MSPAGVRRLPIALSRQPVPLRRPRALRRQGIDGEQSAAPSNADLQLADAGGRGRVQPGWL